MRAITVATGKNAPNGFPVQKYSNDTTSDNAFNRQHGNWNVLNGSAPNGVNATRWLRETSPDHSKLSPLAAWLVEHCPDCVAGRMPSNLDVYCYNGLTEAGHALREAGTPINGRYPANGKTMWFKTADEAIRMQENFIRCYGMSEPMRISWLFDKIRFEESDDDYWNRTANDILAAGTVRVVIGDAEWRA